VNDDGQLVLALDVGNDSDCCWCAHGGVIIVVVDYDGFESLDNSESRRTKVIRMRAL